MKWPKGITLEKIISDNFPSEDANYDELVIAVFENIRESYEEEVQSGGVPIIHDPALPENNLAAGYTNEGFKGFIEEINRDLDTLQDKGSSNEAWKSILGDRFPSSASASRCTNSLAVSAIPIEQALLVPYREKPPWPIPKKGPGVVVVAKVTFPDGRQETVQSDGSALPKGCEIEYRVIRSKGLSDYTVKWQITNTGEDARRHNCLRGEIESSNRPHGARYETTAYSGRHFVQCFVLRKGHCIAYSKEFFINVE